MEKQIKKTMAEQISYRYHDDGQRWRDDAGVWIGAALLEAGAQREQCATDGDVERYTLPDGSVITLAGGGWDYGYPSCWCWRGAGHRERCEAR